MKKTFVSTVIALVLAFNFSHANTSFFIGNSEVDIKPTSKEKTFLLELKNIGIDAMIIEVRNADDEVLSTEIVKNKAVYTKRFNLSKLPEGAYALTFRNTGTKTSQPIYVSPSEIIVNENDRVVEFKPFLKYKNGKLDLTALKQDTQKMNFSIKDENGSIVFKEDIGSGLSVTRRYNVENLVEGNYTVNVQIGDKEYQDYFRK